MAEGVGGSATRWGPLFGAREARGRSSLPPLLTPYADDEIEWPIVFDDMRVAERAFIGVGPTQLAIGASGEAAVAEAVHVALEPFTAPDGRVVLPAWYRVALAEN
jgi:hypothetical protein